MAIEIPMVEDYHENSRKTGANRDGYMPCIVCGRAVSMAKEHWMVYVHGGGHTAVTDEEYEEMEVTQPGAGLGGYPIGPDCLRRNVDLKPYAFRVKAMPRYQP